MRVRKIKSSVVFVIPAVSLARCKVRAGDDTRRNGGGRKISSMWPSACWMIMMAGTISSGITTTTNTHCRLLSILLDIVWLPCQHISNIRQTSKVLLVTVIRTHLHIMVVSTIRTIRIKAPFLLFYIKTAITHNKVTRVCPYFTP